MEKEQINREGARWKELWKSLVESLGLSCGTLTELKGVAERSDASPSLADLTEEQLSILNEQFRTDADELYTRWAYVYDQVTFQLSDNAASADNYENRSDREHDRLSNLL